MLQRLRAASLIRRSLHSSRFSGLCTLVETSSNDDLDNQVLVEGKAWSRRAILNRPSALNAVNTSMGARLQKLYKSWEDNPDIGFVAMKGSGRAFCAGGDIVSLHHLINRDRVYTHAENLEECKQFFRTAYTLTYIIGTYLKPRVALLNGITMGGGAGVSIHSV